MTAVIIKIFQIEIDFIVQYTPDCIWHTNIVSFTSTSLACCSMGWVGWENKQTDIYIMCTLPSDPIPFHINRLSRTSTPPVEPFPVTPLPLSLSNTPQLQPRQMNEMNVCDRANGHKDRKMKRSNTKKMVARKCEYVRLFTVWSQSYFMNMWEMNTHGRDTRESYETKLKWTAHTYYTHRKMKCIYDKNE